MQRRAPAGALAPRRSPRRPSSASTSHHAQADHRLEVAQQHARRPSHRVGHRAPASPLGAPARQRAGGSRSGTVGCPFGQLPCFARALGGRPPTQVEHRRRARAISAFASAPSRRARDERCAPGGTRSSRKRPVRRRSTRTARAPAARPRRPATGAPSASTHLAAEAVHLGRSSPRPPSRLAQPHRLRPHLRAALVGDARLARERDDVVERRLVLAADGRPEVGLAVGLRLRRSGPRSRSGCGGLGEPRRRARRRAAAGTRTGRRAPARAAGARPRPPASTP